MRCHTSARSGQFSAGFSRCKALRCRVPLTRGAGDAKNAVVSARSSVVPLGVLVTAFLLGAAPRVAHAQALDGGDGESYDAPPAERRNGVMVSLQTDFGYVSVEGYPNKLGEIGDPVYRSHVGGVGNSVSLVLGGALRDWLTTGLVVRLGGVSAENNILAGASAIGVQLQGFPLWSLGGVGRDLGLTGEVGVGLGSIVDATDKDDPTILADGGAMSHLSLGVSYEVWKFWLFSAGPVVNYTHQFSQSMTSHLVTGGIKLAFYSAQP